jgi:hypothetical protein
MAAPTFVGAGLTGKGAVAVTPQYSEAPQANDIILLFAETSSADTLDPTAVLAGFADVPGTPLTQGGTKLWAKWKRSDGTEVDPTLADAGDHQITKICLVRGCKTSGDPWNGTPQTSVDTTSDTTGSITGYTTSVVDTLVVMAAVGDLPDTTGTAQYSAFTNAALSSLTERGDDSTNAGNGGALGIASGVKASAGAIGATTYTKAASAVKAHICIALEAAAPNVNGTAAGSHGYAGTASGVVDHAGVVAGSHTYVGTASGQVDHTGTAAGSHAYEGTVSGVVGSPGVSGTAEGSHGYAGSASGEVGHVGTASGSHGYAGAANGQVGHTGTVAGSHAYAATVLGAVGHLGAVSGSHAYAGAVAGVVGRFGTAVGSHAYVGSVAGQVAGQAVGQASGDHGYTGTVAGVRGTSGVASGSHGYAGAVSGTTDLVEVYPELDTAYAALVDVWTVGAAHDRYIVGGLADVWQAGAVK